MAKNCKRQNRLIDSVKIDLESWFKIRDPNIPYESYEEAMDALIRFAEIQGAPKTSDKEFWEKMLLISYVANGPVVKDPYICYFAFQKSFRNHENHAIRYLVKQRGVHVDTPNIVGK